VLTHLSTAFVIVQVGCDIITAGGQQARDVRALFLPIWPERQRAASALALAAKSDSQKKNKSSETKQR